MSSNIFLNIPYEGDKEFFEELHQSQNLRIERIISQGHTSPAEGWYDQSEHEWVVVLEGAGRVLFEDGREELLEKGDHLHIPAHVRHRVSWTDPERLTLWLAVFYT